MSIDYAAGLWGGSQRLGEFVRNQGRSAQSNILAKTSQRIPLCGADPIPTNDAATSGDLEGTT